ncbi:(2Fe-2S)-binding protein [Gordonia sp. TBRC 11910]|uniref:(2Fe-2S)-binding protein n=1 Tax=Gordonia asplenii TaxID=2725283 RepID=A0A848KXZ1_9ACTN|nr:(2Fe-2S)-binding protein [Gordonia asplenii]NMO01081.1 (2Fe-2S)-binding protein [Gordonia asplenii]
MSTLLHDDVLFARVNRVRRALATGLPDDAPSVELRVAASVTHLGLVARVIAPLVAREGFGAPAMSLLPEDLHWQDRLGGPYPLSIAIAEHGDDQWHDSLIGHLTETVATRLDVSRKVLEGNVASAANSAAQMIARASPNVARSAFSAADSILARPGVESGRAGAGYRRRSCCLIYRVSGDTAAVCGDCVLG